MDAPEDDAVVTFDVEEQPVSSEISVQNDKVDTENKVDGVNRFEDEADVDNEADVEDKDGVEDETDVSEIKHKFDITSPLYPAH